jgi:hypothetical protein
MPNKARRLEKPEELSSISQQVRSGCWRTVRRKILSAYREPFVKSLRKLPGLARFAKSATEKGRRSSGSSVSVTR